MSSSGYFHACARLLIVIALGLGLSALDDLVDRSARLESELRESVAERERLRDQAQRLEARLLERDARMAQRELAQQELEWGLGPEIASGDIELDGTDGRMSIGLSDQILFPSGGADLSPRGQAVLTRVARSLVSLEGRLIHVGGHTDATVLSPQLGHRYPTNWELSTARATNVVRFLMERCSIPGERLVASGFAEHQPRASNATAEGRQRNRRIELQLLPLPHANEPVETRGRTPLERHEQVAQLRPPPSM